LPQALPLEGIDRAGWLCRRHLPRLLFAGVFERHPRLKVVLTEQTGEWWAGAMKEYDSSWHNYRWMLEAQMPKPPSEYCRTNVYIGGSYMAPFEAAAAVRDGYVENLTWGSDYPHAEGTYQYPESPDADSTTHLSLRYVFSGIDSHATKMILSDNAIRCYSLDVDKLRPVADRINSPTLHELSAPLEARPEGLVSMGFRTIGPHG
jgi:predicted TIM-barrel fold metal-dependent hydrolase